MSTPLLVIQIPDQPTREVKLEKDAYTIGRAPGNDIVIESPVISREHGRLTRSGVGWMYEDLGSRNGTYSEGKKIVQPVDLHSGVRLQLGKEPARAVMIAFQAVATSESAGSVSGLGMKEEEAPRTMLLSNCPRCKMPHRPDATFCPSCGLNLVSAESSRPEETINAAMLPELVVHDMGGGHQSYSLAKEVMRVGRAADNDIIIPSKLVSSHHLRVDSQNGRVTITDLNSTNGTMVNGSRITPNQPVLLNPGDVIRVGDLNGNSLRITYGSVSEEGLRTQEAGKLDLTKLAKQPSVMIGRSPDCDLSMPHPAVSKHHAMIIRQEGQITIRDLGSTNGTFVNGTRVQQTTLNDGDEIQIGPFRLVYDSQGQHLAGSRRLGHRLDGIHLVRTVKGGHTILNDVSVSIQSSEFVALVGGSGAGKSTLMKALNGYEPATKGQLLIDGQDLYSRLDMLRTEMGYVPQDDIIHRELPVRLALWYAAKLRLPDASEAEIQKTIDDALKAVEMTEHQNKRVKDLSGGQRKRVSIACELLAQPTLFFLDEPTSGLDPGLEKKMMYDLKRLADQGRTIVLVTHATSNIDQCDYVAFMAKGRLAYYGPPKEATTFFDANDFADIYQKLGYEIDPDRGAQPVSELQAEYQEHTASGKPRKVSAGVIWADKFHKSPLYQKYVTGKQANIQASRQSGAALGSQRNLLFAPIAFIQQMYYLARRQVDLIRNDVRTLLILLAMLPLLGLLFGFVSVDYMLTGKGWENKEEKFFTMNVNSQDDIDKVLKDDLKGKAKDTTNSFTPFQDASTLVSMLALALTQAGTFAASYEIVKERPIFQRERAVNLSVWAYVLSKVVVLSLFAVIQVAGMLLLLTLTGVDLDVTGVIFLDLSILEIFISLYLAILASIALGLLISALVPSTDVVLYIILAQLFVQIVLTGALFPVDRNALSYATPGYWATDSLSSIVDLPTLDKKGRSCVVIEAEIPDMNTGEIKKEIRYECSSAKSEQSNLAYYKHEAGHLITSWFAMGAQTVLFTLLTIIVQTRKKAGRD